MCNLSFDIKNQYHIKCSKNVQQITSEDKFGLGRGHNSCADPESFDRGGGPTRTTFFSSFFIRWAIIGTPAKRHLDGVSLVYRSLPTIECWLGSFVIFKGSGSIFLGTPCPPILWIRSCNFKTLYGEELYLS